MKKRDLLIIRVIVIVLAIFSFFLVFNIIKTSKNIKGNPQDISHINYVKGEINYNVILKDNKFLEQKILTNNFSYITALVEYIDTKFKYRYENNKRKEFDYEYMIMASINAKYLDETYFKVENPIWRKEYILVDKKSGTSKNSIIEIEENLKIDINAYNDFYEEFVKEFNMQIKANVEVFLIVNLYDNEKLYKEHNTTLNIPIGVKAFDITKTKNFSEEEIIYNKEVTPKTSYMKIILEIVLLIIINGGGLQIIKLIKNKNKSSYKIEKDKILNEYNDRIAIVINFIDYEKWEIVDTLTFNELLEIANESFEPIIFWERRINKHKEGWFVILKNKVMYRYILDNNKK